MKPKKAATELPATVFYIGDIRHCARCKDSSGNHDCMCCLCEYERGNRKAGQPGPVSQVGKAA